MGARPSKRKTNARAGAAGTGKPKAKRRRHSGQRQEPAASASQLVRVLGENGLESSLNGAVPDELLLDLFRGMLQVRVLDSRMLNLQRQGRIGFYGQCTGQEAAIIGSAAAVQPGDWVVPALREAGVASYLGYPLTRLVAQLYGKSSEVSQGRQMPCHHSWREGKFVSMSSVIGTQMPHATGLARAAQIRGDRCAVLCYLGDGATSATEFHSALNFAAVWKSPVVFVCQNNQWAISVPFAKQTASASVAVKATAYGMPGVRVDGNDAIAVHQEVGKALDAARSGAGPALVEALTYRRLGHSSSDDPTRYRDQKEVELWEKRDPLERMRKFLQSRQLLDQKREEQMEEEIHQRISAAVQEVESHSGPGAETLVEDVFATLTPQLAEQRAHLLAYLQDRSTEQKDSH